MFIACIGKLAFTVKENCIPKFCYFQEIFFMAKTSKIEVEKNQFPLLSRIMKIISA